MCLVSDSQRPKEPVRFSVPRGRDARFHPLLPTAPPPWPQIGPVLVPKPWPAVWAIQNPSVGCPNWRERPSSPLGLKLLIEAADLQGPRVLRGKMKSTQRDLRAGQVLTGPGVSTWLSGHPHPHL